MLPQTDQNFTNADHTKLDGIESGATADQTAAEIRSLVESATDSNVFTDADHTKLNAIEASADVTDTTNVVAALTAGSNVTIAADGTVSSSFTDTNTTYTAGNGLTLTGTEFTHTDTSTQASSSNSGRTYIQSINVDGFGHITGLTTGTETVVNTDTNTQLSDEQVQDIVGAMVSSNTESGIAVTYDDTGGKLNLTVASQTDQNFTNADHTKLDGIESGATADQTAAEIRALVESATDSNVFTDADHSKLNAIEASADVTDTTNVVAALTAGSNVTIAADGTISSSFTNTNTQLSDEQVQDIVGAMLSGNTVSGITVSYQDTDGTIDFSVASQTDENFTTADHAKLDGIAAGAEVNVQSNWNATSGDAFIQNKPTIPSGNQIIDWTTSQGSTQIHADNVTTALTGYATQSYVSTQVSNLVDSAPAALDTLNELAAALGDDANFSTTISNSIGTKLALAGGTMTGDIVMSGSETVDGRDLSVDGAKLDGIETGATADQTAAEIRSLVESATDSNVFTDADHTKLNAIEASADVTDTTNVVAALTAGSNVTIASDGTVSSSFTDTNTTYTAGNGLTLTGTEFTHTDTSTQASSSNSGRTYIQSINVDGFGHITGLTTGTETVVNTDTNTQLSNEQVQDIVGAMVSSNTESGIAVTYDDTGGKLNLTVASQTDQNFTNADHSKLDGIESGATADQTAAEIRSLVESATDSNVFTDADHSKLNAIEASADVTDTTNVVAALTAGSNVTIAADGTISSSFTNTQLSTEQVQDIVGAMVSSNTESGIAVTYDDTNGKLNLTVSSQTDQNFTNADHTKLNGIEASADVTDTTNVVAALTAGSNVSIASNGTISATNTNTQLSNEQVQDIVGAMVASNSESGITVTYQDGDGTLDFSVASQTDQNFTNADHTKLNGIEASADVTDATNVASAGALMTSGGTISGHIIPNADNTIDLGSTSSKDFRNLYIREIDVFNERLRIDGNGLVARFRDHSSVGDGFQFVHLGTEILRLGNGTSTAATFSGNIVLGGTVDGRDVAADGSKLDGIESGATADQSASEIRTLVESASDSNVFTDADHSKLNGIAAGAEVNVQSNWNATSGDSFIQNKPTIPSGNQIIDWTSSQGSTQIHADNVSTALTGYATQSYVGTQISNLVDSSPAALNTLNELAAALGDDANFSTTVTNSIATKAPLASPSFTGDVVITDDTFPFIRSSTNGSGAGFKFSDNSSGSYGQQGTLTFRHSDTASYGSGASFEFSTTESTCTILGGKLMYGEGIYSKPASGTGAGTRKDTNWDTAYGWGDHSAAGYVTSNTQLSTEQVQDAVGLMLTGNTESGITVTYDDTNNEIDFTVASQTDNNFTNADHTKLNGIEASADVTDTTNVVAALTAGSNVTIAADGTISSSFTNTQLSTEQVQDIVGAMVSSNTESGIAVTYDDTNGKLNLTVSSQTDQNFTNADHTKLNGIEASADVTDTTNVVAALTAGSNVTIAADGTISSSFTNTNTQLSNEQVQDIVGAMVASNSESGITVTYQDADGTLDFSVASQTDQNFTNADHTKLNGIETGATADQTAAEIRSLVESATDSNVFTDADHTKLNGIATGAEVNVQSNWNATSGDAYIQNKPTIPSGNQIIDWTSSQGSTQIHADNVSSAISAAIAAPAAPTSVAATVVGETVDVTFNASSTSNIDSYLVYSSVDGSDYGLISIVPPDDFSATMSVIDNAFTETGTQAYRVYAMKLGNMSSAGTASVSYSVSSLEPTNLSVVNLHCAYHVQWDAPSSNSRFVSVYNVYKHEHASQGSLSRSSASLVYSGTNTNFMYQINGSNNNNFHQFWVETTIA